MSNTISEFERRIHYEFKDKSLLRQALTHSTYAYENPGIQGDNERLEFLGDASLQLIISEALYIQREEFPEGDMTKMRSLVVCEQTLADVAKSISLGSHLLLGKGELGTGGRHKPSNLANAMEAVFGAIYMDSDFASVKSTILILLTPYLEMAIAGDLIYDYKSRLLELVQSTRGTSQMRFEIVGEEGPVHERVFTAVVIVDEQIVAGGTGGSKKEAEQNAAKDALKVVRCTREGCILHQLKR